MITEEVIKVKGSLDETDDELNKEKIQKSKQEEVVKEILCKEYIKVFYACKQMRNEIHTLKQAEENEDTNITDALKEAEMFIENIELTAKDKLAEFNIESILNSQYQHDFKTTFDEDSTTQPKKLISKVMNVLFYLVMFLFIILVYLFANNQAESGPPRNLFGYSPMTILTTSMQSVLPKDSLIITKYVDPDSLVVGDDITFLLENNSTMTHRIIEIHENIEGTNHRGFKTQGVDNPLPDTDIVYAPNIIGKVVYCNLLIGQILLLIRENIIPFFILLVLVIWFIYYLKKYFALRKLS
jgi:signal peptidase I, archaeal type